MKHNNYQLLIFDWDGTLMDSATHIVDCMQRAFVSEGLPKPASEAVRSSIGLGLHEGVQMLSPEANNATLQRLMAAYRQQSLVNNSQGSQLFDGVQQTLQTLKRSGYYLAVATGKSRRGLDRELAESGLANYFPITRCADETFSKPNPQMLDEILTDYNLPASEALMIGDSEYDLLMANNIKMDALAVSYGVHERTRLLRCAPQGVIDAMIELPEWLNQ